MGDKSLTGQVLRRTLRAAFRAVLVVDARDDAVNFVIQAATGCPVFPVRADVPDAESCALVVPEHGPTAIVLMGTPGEVDPTREATCDVHAAHFGPTTLPRWVRLNIESARFSQGVCDGGEVAMPDVVAAQRSALCREVNADRAALTAACLGRTGVHAPDVRAINVDASGITVRAAFDLLRLEFGDEVDSVDAARAEIARLLRTVGP